MAVLVPTPLFGKPDDELGVDGEDPVSASVFPELGYDLRDRLHAVANAVEGLAEDGWQLLVMGCCHRAVRTEDVARERLALLGTAAGLHDVQEFPHDDLDDEDEVDFAA